MYHFGTTNNDIYEQGVDEGRRQVLTDLAKIWKDNISNFGDTIAAVENAGGDLKDYLEQEGYL